MQIISIIKSLKYIFIKIISNERILMESSYSMHSEADGSVFGQSRHQKYCLRERLCLKRFRINILVLHAYASCINMVGEFPAVFKKRNLKRIFPQTKGEKRKKFHRRSVLLRFRISISPVYFHMKVKHPYFIAILREHYRDQRRV